MTPTQLMPHLLPNPALREKPGLLRLVVAGPAHGQVRYSPTGYTLSAIQRLEDDVKIESSSVSSQHVRFHTVIYYAEEVAFAGKSWRTWRLADHTEVDHIVAAMHALVQTVHELDVRVSLLPSGQDAVDSNL
jgi:hypothetical protein